MSYHRKTDIYVFKIDIYQNKNLYLSLSSYIKLSKEKAIEIKKFFSLPHTNLDIMQKYPDVFYALRNEVYAEYDDYFFCFNYINAKLTGADKKKYSYDISPVLDENEPEGIKTVKSKECKTYIFTSEFAINNRPFTCIITTTSLERAQRKCYASYRLSSRFKVKELKLEKIINEDESVIINTAINCNYNKDIIEDICKDLEELNKLIKAIHNATPEDLSTDNYEDSEEYLIGCASYEFSAYLKFAKRCCSRAKNPNDDFIVFRHDDMEKRDVSYPYVLDHIKSFNSEPIILCRAFSPKNAREKTIGLFDDFYGKRHTDKDIDIATLTIDYVGRSSSGPGNYYKYKSKVDALLISKFKKYGEEKTELLKKYLDRITDYKTCLM